MKYIGTNLIETKRLILRRLTLDDAIEAFNGWCNSDIVDKYVLWSKHKNVNVTKNLYRMWVEEYNDPTTFRWIVEVESSKEIIGTIDVASKKFLKYGACEIGYCYKEKSWGKWLCY